MRADALEPVDAIDVGLELRDDDAIERGNSFLDFVPVDRFLPEPGLVEIAFEALRQHPIDDQAANLEEQDTLVQQAPRRAPRVS